MVLFRMTEMNQKMQITDATEKGSCGCGFRELGGSSGVALANTHSDPTRTRIPSNLPMRGNNYYRRSQFGRCVLKVSCLV